MGTITVVTSGKGGAGKSTVSAGLGCALADMGHKVLLLDGDAGLRSLDLMLGVSSSAVYDMADVFEGRCEPVRAIYPRRFGHCRAGTSGAALLAGGYAPAVPWLRATLRRSDH